MLRGDGVTTSVAGTGTSASPYVISASIVVSAPGTPTNMVLGLSSPRPPRQQVWWYSPTGEIPVNFVQGTDVLIGPTGFLPTVAVATPVGLAATALSRTSTTLTWGPVANVAYYELHIQQLPDGAAQTVVTTSPSHRLDLTPYALDQAIHVKVRARGVNLGFSLFSPAISFLRPAPNLNDPVPPTVTSVV